MRFALGIIFGGLGVSTAIIVTFAIGRPVFLQVLSLGTWLIASTLATALVLVVGHTRRRASPAQAAAWRLTSRTALVYVALNTLFGLAVGGAALWSPVAVGDNAGLATALLVWSCGHGGYACLVAIVGPFFSGPQRNIT